MGQQECEWIVSSEVHKQRDIRLDAVLTNGESIPAAQSRTKISMRRPSAATLLMQDAGKDVKTSADIYGNQETNKTIKPGMGRDMW